MVLKQFLSRFMLAFALVLIPTFLTPQCSLIESTAYSANLPPTLKSRFFDSNGDPLSGGKLNTYQAGTTTPQATYTDSTEATANANPVILDANGEADVWLDPDLSYKFVLTDSDDVEQWTVDNVIGLLTADAVGTASIQDDAVTIDKIADDAVGADQLRDDASTDVNRAVTTNHIRDDAVTLDKIAAQALNKPGTINCGLAAATTANSNDSIKLTGASAALSSTNPCYIIVDSATPGQLTVLTVTADVTIDLTGAHWGFGTQGDLTDQTLTFYAVNDSGTAKFGIGLLGNKNLWLDANDSATPSSVTGINQILVNSALGSDSTAIQVGWFLADFDDTGGAEEDLWAVQTGVGDISLGSVRPVLRHSVTKYLTGDISADDSDISDLKFTTLTVGVEYTIHALPRIQNTANGNDTFTVTHDSATVIFVTQVGQSAAVPNVIHQREATFTATDTDLIFEFNEGAGAILWGNSTVNETHVILDFYY